MTTATEKDPILRIGSLKAAANRPECVAPSTPLKEAMQIMTAENFSQLPVIGDGLAVKAITWKSIGEWIAAGNAFSESARVEECTQEAERVPACKRLLDICEYIAEHDFVLVCDENRDIAGIVTAADLSGEFIQLTDAFLLIGQIERNLRILVKDIEFPIKVKIGRKKKSIESSEDMTFGQYCYLFEKNEMWRELVSGVDKDEFAKSVCSVNGIRNDIMHFKPIETSRQHIAKLREFSHCLEQLVSQRSP